MPQYSVTLVIPAALQEKGNRSAVALGHDAAELPGNTFAIPFSSDGENITHYACRTQASPGFLAQMRNAANGILPDGVDVTEFGIAEKDAVEVAQSVHLDPRTKEQLEAGTRGHPGPWSLGDHLIFACAEYDPRLAPFEVEPERV